MLVIESVADSSIERGWLALDPQRAGRLDAKRSPRGNNAGKEAHARHEDRVRRNRCRFLGGRRALEESDERDGHQDAAHETAEPHLRERSAKDRPDDAATIGAEGHADADLPGAPRDGERHTA